MILADTSIIVAWLDRAHEDHVEAEIRLGRALNSDDVAVSVVTIAELAAGGRNEEAIMEDLAGVKIVDVTRAEAIKAGHVFARTARRQRAPLPDFFIRATAAVRGWPHLTLDYRARHWWPDVEFL